MSSMPSASSPQCEALSCCYSIQHHPPQQTHRRRPRLRRPTDTWRSDRLLEFLGGAEGNLLTGLDVDRLAGHRIATHAGSTIPHLQNSQPGDLHPFALLQVLRDEVDEVRQHLLTLLLGELMLLRQRIGQLLGADRRTLRCHVSHERLLLSCALCAVALVL